MNDTGLVIRNADGSVLLTTQQTTWSPIATIVAPANESVAVHVPALAFMDEVTHQISYVELPVVTQESYHHRVEINRDTHYVTATGGNRDCRIIVLGR